MKQVNFGMFLEVDGAGMHPIVPKGSIVKVDTNNKPLSNGEDLAVIKVNGKYHVCYYTVYGSQLLMLHDNAPIAVVRLSDAEIIGKVKKVKKPQCWNTMTSNAI